MKPAVVCHGLQTLNNWLDLHLVVSLCTFSKDENSNSGSFLLTNTTSTFTSSLNWRKFGIDHGSIFSFIFIKLVKCKSVFNENSYIKKYKIWPWRMIKVLQKCSDRSKVNVTAHNHKLGAVRNIRLIILRIQTLVVVSCFS